MNPPLVKTTATWPVSARDGVLMPATPTARASAATREAYSFFISFPPNVMTACLFQEYRTPLLAECRHGSVDGQSDVSGTVQQPVLVHFAGARFDASYVSLYPRAINRTPRPICSYASS